MLAQPLRGSLRYLNNVASGLTALTTSQPCRWLSIVLILPPGVLFESVSVERGLTLLEGLHLALITTVGSLGLGHLYFHLWLQRSHHSSLDYCQSLLQHEAIATSVPGRRGVPMRGLRTATQSTSHKHSSVHHQTAFAGFQVDFPHRKATTLSLCRGCWPPSPSHLASSSPHSNGRE